MTSASLSVVFTLIKVIKGFRSIIKYHIFYFIYCFIYLLVFIMINLNPSITLIIYNDKSITFNL
jgi:hypothetical protein